MENEYESLFNLDFLFLFYLRCVSNPLQPLQNDLPWAQDTVSGKGPIIYAEEVYVHVHKRT
jgi:hypothetical protein